MGKIGEQFDQLFDRIERDDQSKADIMVDLKQLKMEKNGGLKLLGTGEPDFEMTDYALSQIFSKLNIPVSYGKRLMIERPDLVADQFNYWVQVEKNRTLLVRYREQLAGRSVRAFLSDKYAPLDNQDVGEILKAVFDTVHMDLTDYHLDDQRLHVRMTFPDMSDDVGVDKDGEEDKLKIGVDIVNSEVGASSMTVTPLIWRLICSNGLRAWKEDGETFRQRHIHVKPEELLNRTIEAIGSSVNRGGEMFEDFKKTRSIYVGEPLTVIEKLSKKELYGKELIDAVKGNFEIEPEHNVFGLINAYTRTARALPNDRRLEMEKLAGRLMTDDLLKEFVA